METSLRQAPRRTDYRATRLLVALESATVVALIVALLAITAIQVVARYLLNSPVRWTEEVGQLGIVWLTFIAAALVSAKYEHVTMRIGGRRLGRRGRIVLAVTAYLVIVASCVAIVLTGVEPMRARMSLSLPATHWPAGLSYAGALIGFVLIAFHSAINALVIVRGGYDEAQEDLEDGVL